MEKTIFAIAHEPNKFIFVILADLVMQGVSIGFFDQAK